MSIIIVRELKPEEQEEGVAVAKRAFADNEGLYQYDMDEIFVESYPEKLSYGFFEHDEMVGVMQLSMDESFNGKIELIGVIPDCRRKSYGRTMMDFAILKADEAGADYVVAYPHVEDEYAIRWFEKIGFENEDDKLYLDIKKYYSTRTCCHNK